MLEGTDGTLYATTLGGLASNGTVLRISPVDGTTTLLHEFFGFDSGPAPGLVQAADGNFYGAVEGGGGPGGLGSLFRIAPDGTFASLHLFVGSDGRRPFTGLTLGSDHHLYGTTFNGGASDLGVVYKVDLPPAAQDGTFTTNEDTPSSGTLSATDFESDPLTFTILTQGSKGAVSLDNASTGAFTYTPQANANGADSFTFKVSDGLLDSGTATVSVTIVPVNDAPLAADGSSSTTVGASVSGTLIGSDVDGDALTFSIVGQGALGTAVVANAATGAFTYTPGAGNSGIDSFTFHVFDGIVFSNTATMTVTISPGANQPPIANNSSVTTLEDHAVSGTLSAKDPEGQRLTFTIVSNGTKGTATITNIATGRFTYKPNRNANGVDSFTFRANDGQLNSNVATVTVTITPVNDPPVARSAAFSTPPSTPLLGTLSASDVDGDPLVFAISRAPKRGTASITNATTSAFTYTPNANFVGTDSFTFKVTDPSGASSSATVSITVRSGSARRRRETIDESNR